MQFNASPLNNVVALLHWRVLSTLLKNLPEDRREVICKSANMSPSFSMGGGQGGFVSIYRSCNRYAVVDVHCHLRELLHRTNSSDLMSVLVGLPSSKEPFNVGYIVSNQCFHNKWEKKGH